MIPVFDSIKKLEIKFREVEYIWIEFTLKIGKQSFDTRFSEQRLKISNPKLLRIF